MSAIRVNAFSIRLLTSSRRITYVGVSGFGSEIVGTEPVEG
jgi:hypothetical protein